MVFVCARGAVGVRCRGVRVTSSRRRPPRERGRRAAANDDGVSIARLREARCRPTTTRSVGRRAAGGLQQDRRAPSAAARARGCARDARIRWRPFRPRRSSCEVIQQSQVVFSARSEGAGRRRPRRSSGSDPTAAGSAANSAAKPEARGGRASRGRRDESWPGARAVRRAPRGAGGGLDCSSSREDDTRGCHAKGSHQT